MPITVNLEKEVTRKPLKVYLLRSTGMGRPEIEKASGQAL